LLFARHAPGEIPITEEQALEPFEVPAMQKEIKQHHVKTMQLKSLPILLTILPRMELPRPASHSSSASSPSIPLFELGWLTAALSSKRCVQVATFTPLGVIKLAAPALRCALQ